MLVSTAIFYASFVLFAFFTQPPDIPDLLLLLTPSIQASFATFLRPYRPKTHVYRPTPAAAAANVFVPLAFSPLIFEPQLFEWCDASSAPRAPLDVFLPLAFSPVLFAPHTLEWCDASSAPRVSDVFVPLAFSPVLFEPHLFDVCDVSSAPRAPVDVFVPLAFSPVVFEPQMFEFCDASSAPPPATRVPAEAASLVCSELCPATPVPAGTLTARRSERSASGVLLSLRVTLLAGLLSLGMLVGTFIIRPRRAVQPCVQLEESTFEQFIEELIASMVPVKRVPFLDTINVKLCSIPMPTTATTDIDDVSTIDTPSSVAPLPVPSVTVAELATSSTSESPDVPAELPELVHSDADATSNSTDGDLSTLDDDADSEDDLAEWTAVRAHSRSSMPLTLVVPIKAEGSFDNAFAVLAPPELKKSRKRSNKKRRGNGKHTPLTRASICSPRPLQPPPPPARPTRLNLPRRRPARRRRPPRRRTTRPPERRATLSLHHTHRRRRRSQSRRRPPL